MTCIIAYLKDGVVHMASDSQITCGLRREENDYDKILINGDIIAAFSGTLSCVSILETQFKKIELDKITNLKNDIYDSFLKPVRELIQHRSTPNNHTFSALIAKKDELIETCEHYTILSLKEKFSIGSGAHYAMGSMDALNMISDLSIKEKLKMSITIASDNDAGTNNNIKYVNTKDLEVIKL